MSWWRKILPYGDRMKMPPRKVTIGFLLLFGLLSLYTLVQLSAGVYESALAENLSSGDAIVQVLKALGLGLVGLSMLGAIYFFVVAVFCSVIIPDLVSAYRAVRRGIAAAPGAYRKCRAALSLAWTRFCQMMGTFKRYIRTVPSRVAALKAEDWLLVPFASGVIAIIGGALYLGWGWASAVVAWLPAWLSHDGSFALTLIVDWMIVMLPVVILITIWGEVFRFVIRRVRGHRERNTPS